MSRLIDVGDDAVADLVVRVGDVLSFAASGGKVERGASSVEALGSFLPAVVATSGDVLSPETPATTTLFRALAPGRARLSLYSGRDWSVPETRSVEILVEAASA
ncbi:MAG TPA: hypothetical protein VFQ67_13440 [Allosphingosinicella sp.]|nr:hypothetical protein [Allosphingosinicella sp.]